MKSASAAIAGSPVFQLCWRGYDRTQVDQFLNKTAADRQRFQESLTRLDLLIANGPDGPNATIAAALREAQDIWAKAEEQAHRLLRDAENQVELLKNERLAVSRRELDRLTTLRIEVASCLEASVAALRTATGLLSGEAASEPVVEELPSRLKAVTLAVAAWAVEPVRAVLGSRGRVYGLLAVVSVSGSLLAVLTHQVGVRHIPVVPAALDSRRVVAPVGAPTVAAPSDPPAVRADTSQSGGQPASTSSALPVARPDGLIVTLTARRSCWIRTIIDGSQRVERLLKPDETILLHAHDEAVLRVGDAAALSVVINDQPAKSLGGDGEVVTIRITRANYPGFLVKNSDPQSLSRANAPPFQSVLLQ